MWEIAGKQLTSRLFVGTASYPSPNILEQSIKASATNVITVSLKRQAPMKTKHNPFWELLQRNDCFVLPNTAGCHTAKEAIPMAQLGRDIFATY